MQINTSLNQLIEFALNTKLIEKDDYEYIANRLINYLKLSSFTKEITANNNFNSIINSIVDYAIDENLIEDNAYSIDCFIAEIMDIFLPRPSEITRRFNRLKSIDSREATKYFYDLANNSYYIRHQEIAKNIKQIYSCEYGDIDITINLSKPEKDAKMIALQAKASSEYPKCPICKENSGFNGGGNLAKNNHRYISLSLDKEKWNLQYSPYVYYNEHCILFKDEHEPMKISPQTFQRLINFVNQFPHYFIGSNADLPIVGGSILGHDHYQGGCYEFAMNKAETLYTIKHPEYDLVEVNILKWPMSVIKLVSSDASQILASSEYYLNKWKQQNEIEFNIHAYTGDISHNTITPILRKVDDNYEMYIVLRNNRANEEYPDGIFHAHKKYHHIKKENIGLIEVMGLAVLPGRLKYELELCEKALLTKNIPDEINHHKEWLIEIQDKYLINTENVKTILQDELGKGFVNVLECCAVYPLNNEGLLAFTNFLEK